VKCIGLGHSNEANLVVDGFKIVVTDYTQELVRFLVLVNISLPTSRSEIATDNLGRKQHELII
jgi:hypothetical protein